MLSTLVGLYLLSAAIACPQHESSSGIAKRATESSDWTYTASTDWHTLNTNYTLCKIGTQQAPIEILSTFGLSKTKAAPKFSCAGKVTGDFKNWGYGPSFTPTNSSVDITSNPSMTFGNETVYLKGWHVHTPADHPIDGKSAQAELHLVHADATGYERAVVAIHMNGGTTESAFFAQFPTIPLYDNTTSTNMEVDMGLALAEANNVSEFWTYEGSLTSPPCREGIRWFVASTTMTTSTKQMQDILGSSKFSAREVQHLWEHQVNV